MAIRGVSPSNKAPRPCTISGQVQVTTYNVIVTAELRTSQSWEEGVETNVISLPMCGDQNDDSQGVVVDAIVDSQLIKRA